MLDSATQRAEGEERTAPESLEIVRDGAGAAALLDPGRRRLLAALREAPDSASGLARRLGDSRQRLNYHLRALEGAGLVTLHEERRRGNFTERVLRPVARRFVIDPGALEELAAEPPAAGDRFSATYLVALAARTVRELAGLLDRAGRERKRLATAAWQAEVRLARPANFEPFVRELSEALAGVVERHHRDVPGSRAFRLTVGAYPGPEESRTEEPRDEEPEDEEGRRG